MKLFKRSSGFNLVELMIVVAIIGILATIATTSYTEYVTRSKRSDAKTALLQVQLAQEKYRANCVQYATGFHATTMSCILGGAHNLVSPTNSPNGYYTIAIGSADTTTYTITATPTFTDTKCGTLGINQAGTKTITGTDSVANCWGK